MTRGFWTDAFSAIEVRRQEARRALPLTTPRSSHASFPSRSSGVVRARGREPRLERGFQTRLASGGGTPINRELFEATIAAVLAGLPLGEVAERSALVGCSWISWTRSRTWRAIWSARPAWTATACTWTLEDLAERASRPAWCPPGRGSSPPTSAS